MRRRRYDAVQPQESASPALLFLSAAHNAMPRTIGDRQRSAVMNELLGTAIDCRMQFDPGDASALNRLSISTSVGVFRPLDQHHYNRACKVGGTYPRMWEKHTGMEPWIAAGALTDDRSIVHDRRVAPGTMVLIRGEDSDPMLPRFGEYQVWRCTSMDAGVLRFGRYRLREERLHHDFSESRPCVLRAFSRVEWDAAQSAERALRPAVAEKAAA
jgi:hypothetical protein